MTISRENKIFCQKCCASAPEHTFRGLCMAILLLLITNLTFAQSENKNIYLNFKEAPISQILTAIEKQSDYRFFYNNDIDVKQKKVNKHYYFQIECGDG